MFDAIHAWCSAGAWAGWVLSLWVTLVVAGAAVTGLALLGCVKRSAARNGMAFCSVGCAVLGLCAAAPEFLAAFRPAAVDSRLGPSEAVAVHVWMGLTAMGMGLVLGAVGMGALGVVVLIWRAHGGPAEGGSGSGAVAPTGTASRVPQA